MKQRVFAWGPIALAVAMLAWRSIATVLARVGHPAAALDDAYIHFQYARAIAEGHPLHFETGEPVTSGATSMLWPAMLAPFYLLGLHGEGIMWPAWLLSFAALGALAWEAARITDRLAGRAAAVGAAAMVLAFSAFTWCATSGMEVVPFAWAIARATRRAADWADDVPEARTPRRAAELVALAWVAALFRPEGGIAALFVAATLAVFTRTPAWKERALSIAAAGAVLATPLLLLLLTGTSRSNTAIVKLLPGNPYFTGHALYARVTEQVQQLVADLLNGDRFSQEFLPRACGPVWMAGLGAIGILGWRDKKRWRAAGVLLIALTMFAPCFYYTFLWNRLRYLWPFASGWLIGLACLARVVGDLVASLRARGEDDAEASEDATFGWRIATPILCGVFAGMLASKVDGTMDDVAWSASGIDRQQVALGRWAREGLPPSARIGVNDTGAIAYFGDHPTFDVVGLTTDGEARYWVAGQGSRFEHYEHLAGTGRLPTHFIVYPEWMAMPMLLGDELESASVRDYGRSILGGDTMIAYVADWSTLGSGERPWSAPDAQIVDAVDVADLESEAAHEYALFGAQEGHDLVHDGTSPDGTRVVDGGRSRRWRESLVMHAPDGASLRLVVRFENPSGTVLRVLAGGEPVGDLDCSEETDWCERAVDIPARLAGPRTRIDVVVSGDGDAGATVFHYWGLKTIG
jgi:hypothetical protein